MNTVILYTAVPAGHAADDEKQVEQFAAELNRFYEKFKLKVEFCAHGAAFPLKKGGYYSVKMLQNPLMRQMKEAALCCVIFLCKKEDVALDELQDLIRNLQQKKKTEIAVYFKPNDDMHPVYNDIIRRIAQIDEKTVFSQEEQQQLSARAKNLLNFGCACDRENKFKEAEAAYRESLVIQKKLSQVNEAAWMQDLSLPYHNLGALYYRMNRLKEAESLYEEAIRTRRKVAEQKGDAYLSFLAVSQMNLGTLYVRTERLEEAEKTYREALGIREKLAVQSDVLSQLQLADVYGNLGNVCSRQNHLEDAAEMFEKALAIQKNALEEDENQVQQKQKSKADAEAETKTGVGADAAEVKAKTGVEANAGAEAETETGASHTVLDTVKMKQGVSQQYIQIKSKAAMNSNALGLVYLKQKCPEKAQEQYLFAEKLYTELAKGKAEEFEPPLAMISYNLGNIFRNSQQMEDAARYFDKAYAICEAYKEKVPMCKQLYHAMHEAREQGMEKQAKLIEQLEEKGKEAQEQGMTEQALSCFQQAAALYRELQSPKYQAKAALLYTDLGLWHWDQEQLKEAETCYQMALLLYRKCAEEDAKYQPEVAVACYNLGIFYQETREEDVNEQLREAFEIAGKHLESSEQCREIYENLEDEPLYESKTAESLGAEQAAEQVSEQAAGILEGADRVVNGVAEAASALKDSESGEAEAAASKDCARGEAETADALKGVDRGATEAETLEAADLTTETSQRTGKMTGEMAGKAAGKESAGETADAEKSLEKQTGNSSGNWLRRIFKKR